MLLQIVGSVCESPGCCVRLTGHCVGVQDVASDCRVIVWGSRMLLQIVGSLCESPGYCVRLSGHCVGVQDVASDCRVIVWESRMLLQIVGSSVGGIMTCLFAFVKIRTLNSDICQSSNGTILTVVKLRTEQL